MSTTDGPADGLVSVVMPVYNAGAWLSHSIGSLKAQSHGDWELLAVDDGSKDDSLARLRALAAEDPRIRPIAMPANGGVAAARNAGIDAARGRWIAFLDSDDAWAPGKLERQVADLRARDLSISYAAYQRVDERGRPLSRVMPPDEVDYPAMLRSNHIGNLTGIYDRPLGAARFRKVGHEDYVFWLDLVRRAGRAARVPGDEPLAFYTVRDGSVSANKLRAAGWQWRIYREIEGLGALRSAWLMLHYAGHALRKRGGRAA
jgi:glycosyltransferase involved in cell wall biosynthesis